MTPEDRAWEVVRRAFEERVPAPRRRGIGNRVLIAGVAAAAVVVAAVFSPPGHAVFEQVRRAVGVQNADQALFSLPAPGRLLVVSAEHGGTWVVDADGARRRIGAWQYARWSPHGLYVIAADESGLSALDPDGHVRWTLPRRGVAWPAWEGTHTDTRIAYRNESGLRIVAGDGTGDRLLDAHADDEPSAWDPTRMHALAYESGGAVVLRQVDSHRVLWRAPVPAEGRLVWSTDGKRLAVVAMHRITVLDANGRMLRSITSLSGELLDAAFRPGTHSLAVSVRFAKPRALNDATDRRSQVKLVDVDHPGTAKLLFAGPGVFGNLAWAPDGRWLLVDWPTADQWVFLHDGRVRAVANVEQQFPREDKAGPVFELDDGWCCPA